MLKARHSVASLQLMWTGPFGFPQGAAVAAGEAPKNGARAKELQKEGGRTSPSKKHEY